MVIGIVGPRLSGEKIKHDLYAISPEIQIKQYVREASEGAIEVIAQCEKECDAVLFTGQGPFASVYSRYEMQIPYEYIPKGVDSITHTFLDMLKMGYEIDRFSIDVADCNIMEDALCELEIQPKHIFSLPFETYREEEYIEWHLQLWEKKKIDVILTGFVRVFDYFKEREHPVFYLPTMRSAVRNALFKLEKQLDLNQASYSKIAVEIFRLTVVAEASENYYSNMIQKNQAESFIITYAQKCQGSFFTYGRNEYVIFANRGYTNSEENYRLLETLYHQIAQVGYYLNAGIGTALTAYQSESNARKALRHSLQSKDNGCFWVDENDSLIGPLGQKNTLEYALVSSSTEVLQAAENSGMSAVSIAKLQSIIDVRKSNIFDIAQLADCLQVTTRSARRIAGRLVEGGYASLYAKEGGSGAGRPKGLYRIDFSKE